MPTKKLRIHFISGSLNGGGAERVLVLLADQLVKSHDVTIITFGEPEAYNYDTRIQRIRLHKGKIKNQTIRRVVSLFKLYQNKKSRPDIAISFLPPVSFVGILVARLFKIKIIACEHINHLIKGSARDQFTRKFLYRYADHLTVLTEFDIDYYRRHGANVTVMPNPVTFKILDKEPIRESRIIAVGNLDRYHHKGFDNLISIAVPVLKEKLSWQLYIIGNGDNGMSMLKDLVRKQGLENQIIFTGFRNDINEIMQRSEIYILSSRFEGLPMVLLEALSQGMACISYDCKTGPSDIIVNGENGILIEDQNVQAMQAGLLNLMENVEFRKTLQKKSPQSLERFSTQTIIKKWNFLLETTAKLG
jgi:glycosyltransferase involved in cell wall biosynthesis